MTDYTELKLLVDRVLTDRRFCGDENHKALANGVLALIGENQQLNAENKQLILLECHGGTAEAAINLLAERDQLKAENERLVEGYDKAWRHDLNDKNNVQALAAEVARLSAKNRALLSALKGMTSMYGYCWDLVDGGLCCMPDNVQRFEDAHEAARKLVAAMGKGEPS